VLESGVISSSVDVWYFISCLRVLVI